jgi:cytosine/adenosine deaminase-related metal-dependent hydrolase
LQFFSADFVFPISRPVIPEGIVAVQADGSIEGVYTSDQLPVGLPIQKHEGIICPGFINTHCHLELSYLQGSLNRHTGLTGFISELVAKRKNGNPEQITGSASMADRLMFDNGISTVGDISNEAVSFPVKLISKIKYHTFIELFDFIPERTQAVLTQGMFLRNGLNDAQASFSPHALYSVTPYLFRQINELNKSLSKILSIHHLETAGEKQLLTEGNGKLAEFFRQYFPVNYQDKPSHCTLDFILNSIDDETHLILVHNTFADRSDIETVIQSGRSVFWCFCPKANLFIENRLPDFALFSNLNDSCCLGTDSPASNDSLCILEEIKTIQKHHPKFKTEQLLRWATWNGARALKSEHRFGSLERSKKPGVICIDKIRNGEITAESSVKRLV